MNYKTLHRYTWVEVHLDRIETNVKKIKRYLPDNVQFIAAVKADAYGHGDLQVAKTALQAGAEGLAVALLSEAMYLRKCGIQAPILVLTAIVPRDVDLAIEHHISVTVYQASHLQEMLTYKTSTMPLRIHVKMDTGLGRIGIREEQELDAMVPLLKSGQVIVEGAYTHFATANHEDHSYYQQQYDRFKVMCHWLSKHAIYPTLLHCANSAAALQFPQNTLDAVRIGVAMLGIYPSEAIRRNLPFRLEPALSLHSKIVQVKQIKRGSYVGYNNAYQAKKDEWIATVPIGYADGWFRCFEGFDVLVEGERMPIIRSICMDQMMIRLPREYPIGTQVTLIGSQRNQTITLDDLAAYVGTVPQEIPAMINLRVPRVYLDRGHVVDVFQEREGKSAFSVIPVVQKEVIANENKHIRLEQIVE